LSLLASTESESGVSAMAPMSADSLRAGSSTPDLIATAGVQVVSHLPSLPPPDV
jgi:hypothetical protein